jgi:hypothetical protein
MVRQKYLEIIVSETRNFVRSNPSHIFPVCQDGISDGKLLLSWNGAMMGSCSFSRGFGMMLVDLLSSSLHSVNALSVGSGILFAECRK